MDLKSGTLTVAADNDEVVQNLTLAFSIAVLQVSTILQKSFPKYDNRKLQICSFYFLSINSSAIHSLVSIFMRSFEYLP